MQAKEKELIRKNMESTQKTKGLMFHKIHGSFVDGHGVRTTLFLKGCPLRCVWCCNPEGQEAYTELKYTVSLCNACGNCVPVCPTSAISLGPDDKAIIDRQLCTNCGECIDVCYTGALDMFGKYYTVDELFNIVKKDEGFYRASGGGVSIGGGEPSFQPQFSLELIKKCKENYIHTAVDTCGYAISEASIKVLQEADLRLFDLKGIDPEQHLKNTRAPNEPILNNLKMLDEMRKPIIVRVPLVPGHTDSVENITSTAELLSKLKSVERVDLLAYHDYGSVKYEQLGKIYPLKGLEPLSQEHLESIKTVFEMYGLKTQLGG